MNIRVVRCEDDSHSQTWMLAKDCTHWSMTCPYAKKAKKSKHKLKRGGGTGYPVAITGIPSSSDPENWVYDYEPPPEALELVTKHYDGKWVGERLIPGPQGNLIECVQCGFLAAM